jgi:hypothetical protein
MVQNPTARKHTFFIRLVLRTEQTLPNGNLCRSLRLFVASYQLFVGLCVDGWYDPLRSQSTFHGRVMNEVDECARFRDGMTRQYEVEHEGK